MTDSRDAIDTLLILGASGDLTKRLLLPGLATLLASKRGRPLQLIGAGMEELSQAQWHERVKSSFKESGAKGRLLSGTESKSRYFQADVTNPVELADVLKACKGTPAIYFALPPAVTAKVCAALSKVDYPKGTNLVLEKPFGVDEAGARKLNELLLTLVPEAQIHRVDHFLGHSDVLNILGTRFANRIFEPVWNSQHVEKIEIVFDEDLTLENRAGYYDHAGALVDMVQSHLLQVLGLLMMEPPASLDEADLRDGKASVIRATHVYGDDPVASSRRARYTAGTIGRRKVPAYTREPGVDPKRRTETLAELVVEVRNWRWAGVPVTLRSGKSLGKARKEIVVTFKPPTHLPTGFRGSDLPTRLHIGMTPTRLVLGMDVNGPGDPFDLDWVELAADLGPGDMESYGQVLAGVLDADPTLSVRGDTAEQCWRILEPVQRAWREDKVPMDTYPAGSDGPKGWPR
ncbi:glucose-6-phosphate dehydrogenase [Nocardioides terrisoli]|uniref:glucose-6-phosphate dehydrogenase n=1 Tax=Nocardioides terrisoli TaxID=3388267 RepID=UPI00287B83F1|nr:glucose-6-phosphate dehydrogenase [Nocardioides marmorisolisilvae]